MTKHWASAFLAIGAVGLAVSVSADDMHTAKGAVQFCEKVSGGLNKKADAQVCQNGATPIPCSKLSDQFCAELWSPKNKGNLQLPNGGQILQGTSDKSLMSHALRLDLEALVRSEPSLPADYRAKVSPVLKELRAHLDHETGKRSWLGKLSELMLRAGNALQETVEERVETAHPELAAVRADDRNITQRMVYKDEELKLKDDVMQAKYKDDPNWHRVEGLFSTVKDDLLDSIEHFTTISSEEKERMREKVKAIKLVMPSSDPRVYDGDEDCSHAEINAAYEPRLNVFSICAGYFNAFQDPDSMYLVMAHELSHSLDPPRSTFDQFLKSPVGDVVQKFCHAQGPAYSCDEWAKVKSETLTHVKKIKEPDYPLKRLSACIHSVARLRPFDNAGLHQAAFEGGNGTMNAYAEPQAFSLVTQPTTLTQNGVIEPNKYFMRPDLIAARGNGDVPVNGECEDTGGMEMYVQDISCMKIDGKAIGVDGLAKLTPIERDPLFKKALEDVQDEQTAMNEHWFGFCGKDCPDLQSSQMGRNAQEDFADWLGHKALERYVARQGTLAEKREAVAAGGALFCNRPSALQQAPDLTRIEKAYSYEPHPDDRVRRVSFFTPAIVQEVGCAVDADTREGTGSCEL